MLQLTTLVLLASYPHLTSAAGTHRGSPWPKLSEERLVFQTKLGDLEMALYPEVHSSCCFAAIVCS